MSKTPRRNKTKSRPSIQKRPLSQIPGAIGKTRTEFTKATFRRIAYNATTYSDETMSLSEIADASWSNSDTVVWACVSGEFRSEVVGTLAEKLGFHGLSVEDALETNLKPKLDVFRNYVFLRLVLPCSNEPMSLRSVSIFLSANVVMTVQNDASSNHFEHLFERLEGERGRIRKRGADYLMCMLIDGIVHQYFAELESINERLDLLEDEVLLFRESNVVAEIQDLRHRVHGFRRLITATRDALSNLYRDEESLLGEQSRPYLRDCLDQVAELSDILDSQREQAGSLVELYLAGSGQRTNEIMRVLTIIATIFMPLGFIAGLYGMNFDRTVSPFNMPELGWRFGYLFCLGLMALVTTSFVVFFWRRGWLGFKS